MKNWEIALISALCTLAGVVTVVFIYGFLTSGMVDVIKEDLIDDYCSSIPMNEARDLEVCNE